VRDLKIRCLRSWGTLSKYSSTIDSGRANAGHAPGYPSSARRAKISSFQDSNRGKDAAPGPKKLFQETIFNLQINLDGQDQEKVYKRAWRRSSGSIDLQMQYPVTSKIQKRSFLRRARSIRMLPDHQLLRKSPNTLISKAVPLLMQLRA
jgi:hypothetical protein